MTVIVTAAADEDTSRAIRAYDAKPTKYGAAFRDSFLAAVAQIGDRPRRFSPVEEAPSGYEIREVYIERFQQRVIFRLVSDTARVIAVVHASAAPTRWLPRVDD